MPLAVRAHRRATLTAPGVCGDAPPIQLYTLANAPLTWLPSRRSTRPACRCRRSCCRSALDPPAGPERLELGPQPAQRRAVRRLPSRVEPAATIADRPQLRRHSVQIDYDGDAGDTIRFGDGVFGADSGRRRGVHRAPTALAAGAIGNVAADAITQIDPAPSPREFSP